MRERDTARSRTALLFMVFAQSNSFPSSAGLSVQAPSAADVERVSHTETAISSVGFFSAAEHQPTAERGRVRLTGVRARLAQGFYLLAHARLDYAGPYSAHWLTWPSPWEYAARLVVTPRRCCPSKQTT